VQLACSQAICALDPELEADIVKRFQNQNIEEIVTNGRSYQGNYSCVIHSGFKASSMLFKYKESGELEDVKLIDFQLVCVGTPVHDLSYFFYSGAEKADMDKLDYYLDLYYHSFSSFVLELGGNPQEIYPFEVLKREWKKYALLGVITAIGMWVGKLMDRSEIITLIENKDLPKEEYFELWRRKTLQVCSGNTFKKHARDICLHAVEYGIM